MIFNTGILYVLLVVWLICTFADPIGHSVIDESRAQFLSTLTENDLNPQLWAKTHGSKSVEVYFNFYLEKLSKLYDTNNEVLSFMMIGACDGKSDRSILQFVQNRHWKGLFVEPVLQNVHDLRRMFVGEPQFKGTHLASSRSIIVRGAALDHCVNDTVSLARPPDSWLRDDTLPHWKSRELSKVFDPDVDKTYASWVVERVQCVTGVSLLRHWTDRYRDCVNCLHHKKQVAAGGQDGYQ